MKLKLILFLLTVNTVVTCRPVWAITCKEALNAVNADSSAKVEIFDSKMADTEGRSKRSKNAIGTIRVDVIRGPLGQIAEVAMTQTAIAKNGRSALNLRGLLHDLFSDQDLSNAFLRVTQKVSMPTEPLTGIALEIGSAPIHSAPKEFELEQITPSVGKGQNWTAIHTPTVKDLLVFFPGGNVHIGGLIGTVTDGAVIQPLVIEDHGM